MIGARLSLALRVVFIRGTKRSILIEYVILEVWVVKSRMQEK